jgi:RHS repeat-associated protein
VLEERVGTSTSAERQYVWGARYVDELICRDRDTNADGTLDERLYALQDANFNVTTIIDTAGAVVERFVYDPYGTRSILDGSFGARASSSYGWDVGHQGLMHDDESGLVYNRNRVLHPGLGRFMQRDPLGYVDGVSLYQYEQSRPLVFTDPGGLGVFDPWTQEQTRCYVRNNCCVRSIPGWKDLNYVDFSSCVAGEARKHAPPLPLGAAAGTATTIGRLVGMLGATSTGLILAIPGSATAGWLMGLYPGAAIACGTDVCLQRGTTQPDGSCK